MTKSAPVMFAGPVAGQEHGQVGHLLGAGEPAGDHLLRGLARHVLGPAPVARLTVCGDPALPEPQVGGHRAGADRVDPDALRTDLLGQRLGEAGQGGLGRAVVEHGGVGQPGVDRADADDRAPARGLHGGQRRAGGPDGGQQVQVQRGLPVLVGDAQEAAGAGGRTADVVDQDVDLVAGQGGEPAGRVGLAEVQLGDAHLAVPGQLVQLAGGLQRARDDPDVAGRERPDDGQPDAPAGPGDDGDPPA